MVTTYIVNAQVYIEHLFLNKTICIKDGKMKLLPAKFDMNMKTTDDVRIVDASGLKAVPGFIDMHIHGAYGYDVNAADEHGTETISSFLAKHGTTAWLASVLTDTERQTEKAIHACTQFMAAQSDGRSAASAELLGIHLEGPFLSSEYKGAMPEELLKKPDSKLLMHYYKEAKGAVRYITLSPELDGTAELIKDAVRLGITVGIGHSGATYGQAMAAVDAGASVGTHVGNAMRLIHQHEPGILGALLEADCSCEIIADGRHLHPGFVKMISKIKGSNRLIAISDSIMAAGLPDGKYKLGINDIVVEDGDAKLASDGTRAGSTLTQDTALKNIIGFTGLALEDVLPMLTENPAKAVGVFDRKGSIADGKDADIVLLDGDCNVCGVFAYGRQII